MPTIAGLRRRGVPPSAIREFCSRVGVTKQSNVVEMELLEFCIRQELESNSPRAMCVLEPLKVVITNWDQGELLLEAPWHPKRENLGFRSIPFLGLSISNAKIFLSSLLQVEAFATGWSCSVTLWFHHTV